MIRASYPFVPQGDESKPLWGSYWRVGPSPQVMVTRKEAFGTWLLPLTLSHVFVSS